VLTIVTRRASVHLVRHGMIWSSPRCVARSTS
jgi:hypothetical protein